MTPEEREAVASISGKLDHVIRIVEVDRKLIDGFDDRLARVEDNQARAASATATLADKVLHLSRVSKPSLSMFTAMIFAGVIGGLTATVVTTAVMRAPPSAVAAPIGHR